MSETSTLPSKWSDAFAPVVAKAAASGRTLSERTGQILLGEKVLESITNKRNLIGEAKTGTGKSFAVLVPAILAARLPPGQKKRTVVSTETMALQDQYTMKDLPFLHDVYGGFKYRSLKGRSNYFCLNRASGFTYNNPAMSKLVKQVRVAGEQRRLGDGEKQDVDRVVGRKVTEDEWSHLVGESNHCAESACKEEVCYSTRARKLAADADIVIVSHALLRTDADLVLMGSTVLGDFDVLVVDEAHKLESVLIDGWSTEITPWGLIEAQAATHEALQSSLSITDVRVTGYELDTMYQEIDEFVKVAISFHRFLLTASGEGWDRSSFALREVRLSGAPEPEVVSAMREYEETGPVLLRRALVTLEKLEQGLTRVVAVVNDEDVPVSGKTARKIRKGLRLTKETREAVLLLSESIKTRDGVVVHMGVPFGVIGHGRTHDRFGDSMTIEFVPLDVSGRAQKTIFNGRTSVLISATLADPIKPGDFSYTAMSMGVENYDTLMVDTPFAYADQQLVYVTPGVDEQDVVPVKGARFSMTELLSLIDASRGRALILFTANAEMAYVADELRQLVFEGRFPHRVLVQERGCDKQQLVEDFKNDESSVLLGAKSFFTGVDFPGNTCSLVTLVKFPLEQYNVLMKMRIAWWKRRGYPEIYERESLLTWAQAIGRLIRTETDHGVVALLDRRLPIEGERVRKTALIGVAATGSRVTRSIDEVRDFLAA